MSKSSFVDFKAVKSAVRIDQVLEHYGLLDKCNRPAAPSYDERGGRGRMAG